MTHTALFTDFGLLLVAAVAGALLAQFLRQPLIVGYILAGIFVSPFTPGPRLANPHAFEVFAEIGVVLLMFSIGIEFSPADLRRVGRVALLGAPASIALMIVLTALTGAALGWPRGESIAVGAAISISSTMVLLKFLQDRGEMAAPHGRVMVGVGLVEDLAVVVMVILLPTLNSGGGEEWPALLRALLRAVMILVPLYWVARRLVPALLDRVARMRNAELFVIVTVAIAADTVAVTAFIGLSPALGAFLGGLLINASEHAHETLARVLPIRDVFVAMFFVSVGMLVQPALLGGALLTVAVLVLLVVVGLFVVWAVVIRAAGYDRRTAVLAALGLAQIGEFSYVVAAVGLAEGLVRGSVYQAVLAASLISIVVNALLFRRMPAWLSRRLTAGPSSAGYRQTAGS